MALELEVSVTFGRLQPSLVRLQWGDRLLRVKERCGFLGDVDMRDWQLLTSSFKPLRDGATWQESFSDEEAMIVVCQPRPIRLLFMIDAFEIAIQVHHAESLEDVLARLPIGPSLMQGKVWVSMTSGYSIVQGDSCVVWLYDSDTIVAWPIEVRASQQEMRKQAREEEEEDELLRHIQLPGGTSAVCDDGENDGTGMMFANDVLQSVTKESEYYLDPIAPSVGGLGLNSNSEDKASYLIWSSPGAVTNIKSSTCTSIAARSSPFTTKMNT